MPACTLRRGHLWALAVVFPTFLCSLASQGAQLQAQDGDAPEEPEEPPVDGEPDAAPLTAEQGRRLLEEMDAMRRELDELKAERTPEPPEEAAGLEPGRLPGYKGGLYDKPFLQRITPDVHIGGYFDVEYRSPEGGRHRFDLHRFIPFFYADLHERVKFASELEIEHGSEVAMEFAFLDLLFFPQVNVRGGLILDPLGKFNLIHDSPINDLTDRPLVNQFVIPTTLREIGAGIFGTLTPEESQWEVKYEAYAVSGFKGLAMFDTDGDGALELTPAFTAGSGIRSGRASSEAFDTRHFDDINDSFAGVGRLSVSPLIGTEVGVSAHSGNYDEDDDNNLTILALDGLYTLPQLDLCGLPVGPIEVQGEFAYDFIERDSAAAAAGVPGDIWGYYVQMNYHFMPAWLTDNAPVIFFPGSTFTFVTRWGHVDLDGPRRTRLTFGLNYRPVESAVIKFDYQINEGANGAPGSADDNAFLVSIAAYF